MVRVTVLAAANVESPACSVSIVQAPTLAMLTIPIEEIEHTELPAVTE
jgi:hypothetical protein